MLLGLIHEPDGLAGEVLRFLGADLNDARRQLLQLLLIGRSDEFDLPRGWWTSSNAPLARRNSASSESGRKLDDEHLQDLRRHRDYVNSQAVGAQGQ